MMKREIISGAAIAIFILLAIVFGLWGCPKYRVYSARLEGQAEMQKAEQNRNIQIITSRAKKEAAQYEAEAEVVRARGVDSAIRIISGSLQSNTAYIQYLWVNNMEKQDKTVVYVPSGAMGIPLPEAARLNEK